MKNCPLCEKVGHYQTLATPYLQPLVHLAKAGGSCIVNRISTALSQSVLSDVCILKIMWVSSGILIGSMCTEFFKKHRKFVIFALIASILLFLFRVYQLLGEWDEDTSEF